MWWIIYWGGWVLTAAHCIDNDTPVEGLAVMYGSTSLTNGGKRVPAKLIEINSDWSPKTLKNDIALIKTDISSEIPAVVISSSKTDAPFIQPGNKLLVSGWGTTSPNGNISVDLLRVQIPVVSLKTCNASYNNEISDNQLCVGEVDKDSCQGDSGGPLTGIDEGGSKILVGIVSYGKGCGLKGNPGIYTRVSSYTSWIQNVTKLNLVSAQ